MSSTKSHTLNGREGHGAALGILPAQVFQGWADPKVN